MALILINGHAGLEAKLCFPRVGAWHADIQVDHDTALTGAVRILIDEGALVLEGTVSRGGAFAQRAAVRVVAGAAGLGRTATPRHYNSTSPRVLLADLLADAGESLSSTADASVLDRQLDAWTTAALPVGALLARLCATLGAGVVWRMLPDGTLWIGTETWPDSGLEDPDDYQVLDEASDQGYAVLGVEAPTLLPGTTLADRRVSYVEHVVGAGVRTHAWYEEDGATSDRFKAAWVGALGGPVTDVFYRARYLAKIVSQSGGTVDAEPEDERLPPMAGVPLLTGLPGTIVDGSSGGRVLLGWHGADPSRPFAESFDADTRSKKIVINANDIILGGEAGAQPAVLGDVLASILASIKSHIHVCTGGTVSASVLLATLPDPRAAVVKVK